LTIEPGITLYSKGEADLRDLRTRVNPDGTPIPGILSGTVERTVRPSLYFRYQPVGINVSGNDNVRFNFWMDADVGVNFTDNKNHIDGFADDRFIGLFRMSGALAF
jgi:hypothetical protein